MIRPVWPVVVECIQVYTGGSVPTVTARTEPPYTLGYIPRQLATLDGSELTGTEPLVYTGIHSTTTGYTVFFFGPILLVSGTLLVWNCSGIRRKTACCGFFHYEKSDGFESGAGANPRSWVPEASTQTPRPPKPLNTGRI
jgi:hypothetical protein